MKKLLSGLGLLTLPALLLLSCSETTTEETRVNRGKIIASEKLDSLLNAYRQDTTQNPGPDNGPPDSIFVDFGKLCPLIANSNDTTGEELTFKPRSFPAKFKFGILPDDDEVRYVLLGQDNGNGNGPEWDAQITGFKMKPKEGE